MTADEIEAGSLKFERAGSVILRQLSSGRWAMYPWGGQGSPFWIGDEADIVSAYADRPAPIPVREPQRHTKRGTIDLSSITFDL